MTLNIWMKNEGELPKEWPPNRGSTVLFLNMSFVFFRSVTGGELFHYLAARDRVNEDEAVEFLLQILKGVKHMHQKSIVHLDLKVGPGLSK